MDDLISQAYDDLQISSPAIFIINAGRFASGYVWDAGECGTPHYAGHAKRYVWLDVNAGPVEWGPLSSGEGTAGRHVLPFVFDPADFRDNNARTGFLSSLAGYVARATTSLLNPTLSRFVSIQRKAKFILIAESDESLNVLRAHYKEVCQQLQAELAGSDLRQLHERQTGSNSICVAPTEILTRSCPHCVAAIQAAVKFHTSPHLGESHAYLDAPELHHALQRLLPHFAYLSHEEIPMVLFHGSAVLPGHNRHILFDRAHQAVAFDKMVLGMVSAGPMVSHDFYCDSQSNVHRMMNPGNATRALITAAMDVLWAVSPTHVRFDEHHNRTTTDYMWSVFKTSAGLFSHDVESSFFTRDEIGRNAVAVAVSSHYDLLVHLLEAQREALARMPQLVGTHDLQTLRRRWAVWRWKRKSAETELSLYSYHGALAIILSMHHDVIAVSNLVMEASFHRLQLAWDCEHRVNDAAAGEAWGVFDFIALTIVVLSTVLCWALILKVGKSIWGGAGAKKKKDVIALPKNVQEEFLEK